MYRGRHEASTLRKITSVTPDKGAKQPASLGPMPEQRWIEIALLRVDETYQRPIAGNGERNVRRIFKAFNWTMFAPVVVCPIEGGLYAIVDGQHRTTAALMCGITQVPCLVIQADGPAQARAFHAINGSTTAMSPGTLYKARLAAHDPEAVRISKIVEHANVRIHTTNPSWAYLKPRETVSPAFFFALVRKYADDHLLATALKVAADCAKDQKGLLNPVVISVFVELLQRVPAWCHAICFEGLDLRAAFAQAKADGVTRRGSADCLTQILENKARHNDPTNQWAERNADPHNALNTPVHTQPRATPALVEQLATKLPSPPSPPICDKSKLKQPTTMPVIDADYLATMRQRAKDDPLRKVYTIIGVHGGYGAYEHVSPAGTEHPMFAPQRSDLEDVLAARGLEQGAGKLWYPRRAR